MQKIDSDQYKIEDCTYEHMIQVMMEYRKNYTEYPKKDYAICNKLCSDLFIDLNDKKYLILTYL